MRIYNTLTRRKEDFVPRDDGKVSIYACGPTVYNYIHIGNARTFLNFDVIRRYLEYVGHDVRFIQNITDVDDKIIKQSIDEGIPATEVADKYTAAFEEAMRALRIKEPTVSPKATEHVPGMIEMIEQLIERGHAYEIDGDVYFEVRKFADYGKLSGRALEDMRAGERVEIDERKRDPMDFALWKSAKPGEPSWDSPWGKGRPGWHIECSVMSTQYLGYSFDIHGGASDLIFPHHENEIAQAEAATGVKPFVRIWMHAGLLNVNKQKMAKSLGNFTLLKDVLAQGYDANTIRMLMLGTHYRKQLDFSDAALDEARAKVERIANCLRDVDWATKDIHAANGSADSELASAVAQCETEFKAEMDDDFNSAGALGAVFDLVGKVNVFLKEHARGLSVPEDVAVECAAEAVRELTGVLGLELPDRFITVSEPVTATEKVSVHVEVAMTDSGVSAERMGPQADSARFAVLRKLADELGISTTENVDLVKALLDKRAEARAAKDWATSDAIRDKLAEAGLAVEDTPQGQRVIPVPVAKA